MGDYKDDSTGFFSVHRILVSCAVAASIALPAWGAELISSKSIYRNKKWEVVMAAYDNNTVSCIARVEKPGSAFAIWGHRNSPLQIQFWNNGWNFTPDREDIIVQVDRRPRWDLNNAELEGKNIWFTLPAGKSSGRFLREIRRGNNVTLKTAAGTRVDTWSLAGSSATMNILADCIDVLRE